MQTIIKPIIYSILLIASISLTAKSQGNQVTGKEFKKLGTSDLGFSKIKFVELGNPSNKRNEESYILAIKLREIICIALTNFYNDYDTSKLFHDPKETPNITNEFKRIGKLTAQTMGVNPDLPPTNALKAALKDWALRIDVDSDTLTRGKSSEFVLFIMAYSYHMYYKEFCIPAGITPSYEITYKAYSDVPQVEINKNQNQQVSGAKSYCYTLNNGSKYRLNLFESSDSQSKAVYNFYNENGVLIKSMTGTYNITDEGVYSPVRKIVANFSGNKVKWLILYDTEGKAQSIQDEIKNTIWDKCY